jgi:uncharacterized protein YqeY
LEWVSKRECVVVWLRVPPNEITGAARLKSAASRCEMAIETFENLVERACRKAQLDVADGFRIERRFAVLGGLIWLGIGALVCHLLGVSSYYGFALALLISIVGWRDVNKVAWELYVENVAKQIGSALDKKIELAADVSRRIDGLEQQVNALLYRADKTEAELVSARWNEAVRAETSPPRSPRITITPASLPDVATETDLERAVAAAIKEVGATSPRQMGMVIKAARSHLRGKRFDEEELGVLVHRTLPHG